MHRSALRCLEWSHGSLPAADFSRSWRECDRLVRIHVENVLLNFCFILFFIHICFWFCVVSPTFASLASLQFGQDPPRTGSRREQTRRCGIAWVALSERVFAPRRCNAHHSAALWCCGCSWWRCHLSFDSNNMRETSNGIWNCWQSAAITAFITKKESVAATCMT